jgi:hypothetical protein
VRVKGVTITLPKGLAWPRSPHEWLTVTTTNGHELAITGRVVKGRLVITAASGRRLVAPAVMIVMRVVILRLA